MLNELGEKLDELANRQEVNPLEPDELRDCQEVSPEALNQLAEPLNEVHQLLKQQKHLKGNNRPKFLLMPSEMNYYDFNHYL